MWQRKQSTKVLGYHPYFHILRTHFALVFRKSVHVLAGSRTASNQIALESNDPGTFNGKSNFEIRPLGIDLVSFEVAMLAKNLKLIDKNLSRKF